MKNTILLLMSLVFLSSCGFEIVDDGNVGVKKTMGKIEKDEYQPGIHFYNPFTTSIFEMDIRERAYTDNLSGYSEDNQIINAEFKANFRPDSKMMAELYISQGENYANILLPQRVGGALKEVLGKYKATDISQSRAKITSEAVELIRNRLEGTHLSLVSFEVTNFDYDDAFEEAVKAKVVAKERAIEEQNRTVQVIEQNKQKLNTEQTEAQAIKIKAAALAQNKDLIQLEAVKRWNGILPQTMLGGGALPFINVDTKK